MRPFLPVLLILFLLSAPSAFAAKGTLKVSPAVTEVIIASAEREKVIEFTYTNNSDKSLLLELEPVNFRQKGDYGEIGFLDPGQGSYLYSLSSFLILAENTLELAPKESKKVKVTVKNRDDLTPGGHYGALIARISNAAESQATPVFPSISALILLRKSGGERFNLSLSDINFPRGIGSFSYPTGITLLFQNEGNVHMVPYGRVEVRDIFNRLLYKGIINTSSLRVLPSSRRYINVPLANTSISLPISINTVSVTGEDSLKKTRFLYKESYIYINPVFLLLLVVLPIILRLVRKKKAKRHPGGLQDLKP